MILYKTHTPLENQHRYTYLCAVLVHSLVALILIRILTVCIYILIR